MASDFSCGIASIDRADLKDFNEISVSEDNQSFRSLTVVSVVLLLRSYPERALRDSHIP